MKVALTNWTFYLFLSLSIISVFGTVSKSYGAIRRGLREYFFLRGDGNNFTRKILKSVPVFFILPPISRKSCISSSLNYFNVVGPRKQPLRKSFFIFHLNNISQFGQSIEDLYFAQKNFQTGKSIIFQSVLLRKL